MKNVSEYLRASFPDIPIFPTVGNHDVWPANQIPDTVSQYYSDILSLAGFDKLLEDAQADCFKKG